jgi:hypothetical protein
MTDLFNRICNESLENGGAIVGKHMCSATNSTLNYEQCTIMILDIGGQIEILRENGLGLLYLTPDDITITSDGSYLLTPLENPVSCDIDGMLSVERPFKYNALTMAPELQKINKLPSKVFYTCIYYSLKYIAIKMIGVDSLKKLYPTKLFYLLERCCVDEPKDRIFIFV